MFKFALFIPTCKTPKLLQIMGLEAIREVLRHMELALIKSSDSELKLSMEPTSAKLLNRFAQQN